MVVALAVLFPGSTLRSEVVAAPSPPVHASPGFDEAKRAWTFSRLAEANNLLRRRRPRAAARVFQEVLVQTQGTQWATLAKLGLAWSVAASGDAARARALAFDVQASAGVGSTATAVVFGLLSAKTGDYAVGLDRLDEAARTTAQPSDADVIRLTKAYVLFWSGEFDRAANEFDAVANSTGGLADDARYGAAWSRWTAGASARAREELSALVRDAPPGFQFRAVPRRLVELDERAVLGDSTRRYRRGGIPAADAQIAQLLDSDGFSRAWSALRLLDEQSPTETRVRRAAQASTETASPFNAHAPGPQGTVAHVQAPNTLDGISSFGSLRRSHWAAGGVLLVLLVLAVSIRRALVHARADSGTRGS